MRKSFAQAIEQVMTQGGSGSGASNVEASKLEAENKKLQYRIIHLLRALDEKDGKVSRTSQSFKVYTDSQDSLNVVQVVADLVGANLDVEVVSEETRKSKEFLKLNPANRYPLLKVDTGVITGTWPIAKYISNKSKQLVGQNALEDARINQWIGWNATQLYPSSQLVVSGVFGSTQLF